jgi:HK97 family phage prohead protease
MLQVKTLSLNNCDVKLDADTGIFAGYASTFDNIDSYGDTILKGAYKRTLAENGIPKMFFNHDSSSLPIGKWLEVGEDKKGLYVKGELTDGMSTSNDVKAALMHETLDGLSIGYALKKTDYTPSDKVEGGRIIKNVSRLAEVSVVTFPADSFAKLDVVSLKSELEALETIREFEHYLRDVGNFSRDHAKMMIAQAKVLFGQRDAGDEVAAETIKALHLRLDRFAAN